MTEDEARQADLTMAKAMEGKLCWGCPPAEYPNASTRCDECPRKAPIPASAAEGRHD